MPVSFAFPSLQWHQCDSECIFVTLEIHLTTLLIQIFCFGDFFFCDRTGQERTDGQTQGQTDFSQKILFQITIPKQFSILAFYTIKRIPANQGEIGTKPGDGGKFSDKTLTVRGIPLDFHISKMPCFYPKFRLIPLPLEVSPYLLGKFKTNQLIEYLPSIRDIAITYRVFTLNLFMKKILNSPSSRD